MEYREAVKRGKRRGVTKRNHEWKGRREGKKKKKERNRRW